MHYPIKLKTWTRLASSIRVTLGSQVRASECMKYTPIWSPLYWFPDNNAMSPALALFAVLPNCSKHHLRHKETHWKKSFKHQDYEAASSDFGLCMRKTVNYISIDISVNQSAYITRFMVLILFSPLTTPKEKPANEFLICNTSVSAGSIKFKVLQENIT